MRGLRILAGTAALGFAIGAAWHYGLLDSARIAVPVAQVSSAPLENVDVQAPPGEPKGVVVLVSDKGGIAQPDRDLAEALLARDLVVLPVDLDAWRRALDAQTGTCVYLGSAIEGLAKEAQRALGLESYYHPVVAGRGEGGTLAYAAVADSPAATMAGGLSFEAAPALRTRLPVCAGANPTPVEDGGFSYDSAADLPEPFVALATNATTPVPEIATHGPYASQPMGVSADEALEAGADMIATLAADDATALPVVDTPAAGTPAALAVFYSGDGGWRDLDKTIGDALAEGGVHVVGVDSLRYFWSEKRPEQIAEDLRTIVATADPTGTLPVALLGYSFGADTLPFAVPLLDQGLRDRVTLIGLLAPGLETGFEVSIGGWLGLSTGSEAIVPQIAALPAAKILCVEGRDEPESACADPALSDVSRLTLDGGHHFDGNYGALAARIRAAIASGPQAALATPTGS